MEVTKTAKKRRRRAGRKKKILSPYSRRVLQDLADQDCQLIESKSTQRTFDMKDVGTVAPHNQILHLLDDGGEEKLAEKLYETLDEKLAEKLEKKHDDTPATAQTDAFITALPHAADSNSQDKSGHNAQKMTLDLIQRKGTQLPTLGMGASLGSYVEKDEDKPMESYSNEVLIYSCFASVMIRYQTDF